MMKHYARLCVIGAAILFALAALGGFHWLVHTTVLHVIGLIAFGLLLLALSVLE